MKVVIVKNDEHVDHTLVPSSTSSIVRPNQSTSSAVVM